MARHHKLISLIVLMTHTLSAYPCLENNFLPKNDLSIPPSVKNSGLTREEYDAVIDKIHAIYAPIAKDHGALLKMDRKWDSPTVNAGTYRDEGGYHWHINLYGGYARHRYTTQDSFALVICHELGHHIGGAPKKRLGKPYPMWSSTEGQADYFSTLKCLRKVFAKDNNINIVSRMEVPSIVEDNCRKSFIKEKDVALCIRMSMAGQSAANVSADARKVPLPDFATPDETAVRRLYESHPGPQCRLDTYFQGAICQVKATHSVSQSDEVKGTCHERRGHTIGLRPKCWFGPL